jgi:hypothetical protein
MADTLTGTLHRINDHGSHPVRAEDHRLVFRNLFKAINENDTFFL